MTDQALRGVAFATMSVAPGGASSTEAPAGRGILDRLRRRRDAARLRRAQRGDAVAFAELWRAHARLVHAILLSMVSDEDADDLMQDVALSAWTHLASVRSADRLSAWISTIARNAGRDALRRADVAPEPLPAEGVAVDRDPSAEALADLVMERIRALPEAYREALALRLLLGYSAAEIAERTGMTTGSVRVNLCRGMRRLRAQMEDLTW